MSEVSEVAAGMLRIARFTLMLGRVRRLTLDLKYDHETVTTHTVMLALVVRALSSRLPNLDAEQMVGMALVHDLVESICGDTPTLIKLTPDQQLAKDMREREALHMLRQQFAIFPPLVELLDAYEGDSPEAQTVRVLDKILPKILHVFNGCRTARIHNMTREQLEARLVSQGIELRQECEAAPELVHQLFDALTVLTMKSWESFPLDNDLPF